MNPVAAIAHIIAIVAGIWGGLWLMDRVAPDLPDPGAEPGVAATAPEELAGDAGESLFREAPLRFGHDQLQDQLAAGQQIVRIRVEPGTLHSESRDAQDGLIDLDDIPAGAPERIVSQIAEERPRVTLAKVRYMDLVATGDGPRWYVQLVSDNPQLTPPRSYIADLEGDLTAVGGPEPVALAEE